MSNKLNNSGLSTVFSSVIMIFLGISAVVILYGIIYSNIQEPLFSPEFDCLNYKLEKPIISKACFNNETSNIELKITNQFNESIKEIYFIYQSNNKSSSWVCSNSCGSCELPKENQQKTYYLKMEENPTKQNGKLSITLNSCPIEDLKINEC